MPYLHWETDRHRAKFDELMRNVTEKHVTKEAEKFKKTKYIPLPAQENSKVKLRLPGKKRAIHESGQATALEIEMFGKDAEAEFHMINTATEAIDAKFKHEVETRPKSKFSRTKFAKIMVPGILAPTTVLGQVLHRAAILSEAMDYYQEHELLKKYLHNDPPFHPRRTLDQSYYWTLKSTKKRDRDQVVYRGTAPRKEFMHRGVHCKSGCGQCLDDIRKVPRVIMVDQLWLWILDGSKSRCFSQTTFTDVYLQFLCSLSTHVVSISVRTNKDLCLPQKLSSRVSPSAMAGTSQIRRPSTKAYE